MIYGKNFYLPEGTLGAVPVPLIGIGGNCHSFKVAPGWANTEFSGNAVLDGPGSDTTLHTDSQNSNLLCNTPWNWGQYPLKLRVKEYGSNWSDIWVTGPDVYYSHSGFQSIWAVPHGSTTRGAHVLGQWNITFTSNREDRIISVPVNTSPIVIYSTAGTPEVHVASDASPTTASQGVILTRARGFRVVIVADANITAGTVEYWYWNHYFSAWYKSQFSYTLPTGVDKVVLPDEIVSVPIGRVYAKMVGVTTGGGVGGSSIIYEVAYATN